MKGVTLPSHRARAVMGIAILAVIGVTWWYLERSPGPASGLAMASGTIEAVEVSIAAEVGGRVARLDVEEGDLVPADKVLLELDGTLLQAQARQAQAGVEVAQANLALVERGARREEVSAAEAVLGQAVAQRDAARKGWENAQAIRDNPQELNAQIDAARAQLEAARARLDQVNKGATESEIAAAEAGLEAARATLAQTRATTEAEERAAEANLDAARARLEMVISGATPEQVREAEAAARAARNQLYATQSQGDAYLGSPLAARGQVIYTQEMKEAQTGVAYEQVQAAEARLAQVTAPPRSETVRQTQAVVTQAEAQLAARQQTRQETIEAATANLAAAAARLARVQEGASEEERRIVRAGLAQVDQQLQNLLAMRENPLAMNAQVDAAQGQHRAAEAAVRAAEARLEALRAGPTAEQLAVARAQLSQAQATAGVLEAQMARMTLRTPIRGLVSRRAVAVGEMASPGMSLVTIADMDSVKLVVYVPETKVGLVRLGQPVEVAVDSFPGQVFAGEVIYISPHAEFTPRNVQSQKERANTVFAVKVRIPNPEHRLKAGMPADARLGL